MSTKQRQQKAAKAASLGTAVTAKGAKTKATQVIKSITTIRPRPNDDNDEKSSTRSQSSLSALAVGPVVVVSSGAQKSSVTKHNNDNKGQSKNATTATSSSRKNNDNKSHNVSRASSNDKMVKESLPVWKESPIHRPIRTIHADTIDSGDADNRIRSRGTRSSRSPSLSLSLAEAAERQAAVIAIAKRAAVASGQHTSHSVVESIRHIQSQSPLDFSHNLSADDIVHDNIDDNNNDDIDSNDMSSDSFLSLPDITPIKPVAIASSTSTRAHHVPLPNTPLPLHQKLPSRRPRTGHAGGSGNSSDNDDTRLAAIGRRSSLSNARVSDIKATSVIATKSKAATPATTASQQRARPSSSSGSLFPSSMFASSSSSQDMTNRASLSITSISLPSNKQTKIVETSLHASRKAQVTPSSVSSTNLRAPSSTSMSTRQSQSQLQQSQQRTSTTTRQSRQVRASMTPMKKAATTTSLGSSGSISLSATLTSQSLHKLEHKTIGGETKRTGPPLSSSTTPTLTPRRQPLADITTVPRTKLASQSQIRPLSSQSSELNMDELDKENKSESDTKRGANDGEAIARIKTGQPATKVKKSSTTTTRTLVTSINRSSTPSSLGASSGPSSQQQHQSTRGSVLLPSESSVVNRYGTRTLDQPSRLQSVDEHSVVTTNTTNTNTTSTITDDDQLGRPFQHVMPPKGAWSDDEEHPAANRLNKSVEEAIL
jgi:hypothetical protein